MMIDGWASSLATGDIHWSVDLFGIAPHWGRMFSAVITGHRCHSLSSHGTGLCLLCNQVLWEKKS